MSVQFKGMYHLQGNSQKVEKREAEVFNQSRVRFYDSLTVTKKDQPAKTNTYILTGADATRFLAQKNRRVCCKKLIGLATLGRKDQKDIEKYFAQREARGAEVNREMF